MNDEIIASLHTPLQQEQKGLNSHRATDQAHSPLSESSRVKAALSGPGASRGRPQNAVRGGGLGALQ